MHQLHTSHYGSGRAVDAACVPADHTYARYVGWTYHAKSSAAYMPLSDTAEKQSVTGAEDDIQAGQLRQAAVSRLTQGRPDY